MAPSRAVAEHAFGTLVENGTNMRVTLVTGQGSPI